MTESPEGGIPERADRPVPLFLKLSYLAFSLFGVVYLLLYWAGETAHSTRGPRVAELNRVLDPVGAGTVALVATLLLGFVALLLWLAFRRGATED